MSTLDERVQCAHGEAWQAEGLLRASRGGGTEFPGVRLMATGLPHAQWNNGDVTDGALFRVEEVRAWYAERAGGQGVPWGVRVPASTPFAHGQWLFRKRCMGLMRGRIRSSEPPPGVDIRVAGSADVDTVAAIDAAAFGETLEPTPGDIGKVRVAAKRLTGVHVGEVHLDEGDRYRRKSVAQGHAGVGEGGRVDDDEIDLFAMSTMHPLYQLVFGIALEVFQHMT